MPEQQRVSLSEEPRMGKLTHIARAELQDMDPTGPPCSETFVAWDATLGDLDICLNLSCASHGRVLIKNLVPKKLFLFLS